MQKARPAREADWDTVVRDDLRPAGNGKDCFYCAQPLGGRHKADCVIRKCAGQYVVAIRHNASGEVRMYRHDMTWGDDEFMWTEGNYGCDCNRHLFFERAAVEDFDWDDFDCGNEAYSVLYAELPDGTRIPIDSQSDAKPEGG